MYGAARFHLPLYIHKLYRVRSHWRRFGSSAVGLKCLRCISAGRSTEVWNMNNQPMVTLVCRTHCLRCVSPSTTPTPITFQTTPLSEYCAGTSVTAKVGHSSDRLRLPWLLLLCRNMSCLLYCPDYVDKVYYNQGFLCGADSMLGYRDLCLNGTSDRCIHGI